MRIAEYRTWYQILIMPGLWLLAIAKALIAIAVITIKWSDKIISKS